VKNKLFEIINGTLLGDACIQFDNYKYKKYFSYKLSARDRNFLEWVKLLFEKSELSNCWISVENKNPTKFALYFYINSCPYKQLLKLRNKWYTQVNGKTKKIIPRDLQLNSTVLLHWYLGDGSLIRRKNDSDRVPFIVLATNTFSKEDIDFLIQKLKELNLNFYPVKYKSGFTKKESGYCLYSNTQDGTPFRFFKLIGKCPKEISNCSTGRKGIYHEEKFFKDKWPTEEDWIKILSNVRLTYEILKKRREEIGLSISKLSELTFISPRHLRHIELGDRTLGVNKLRKVLKTLNLDISYLLNELRREEQK
jgi:hypothetical protein